MERRNQTFRIFISSTFGDLVDERNVLQAVTVPRLERYCRERGARFQAIDLRWGVSDEASLDQQAMNICLGEIRRCQRVTPRPNFLVLLGQRYGQTPPPSQVPHDVFVRIRSGVEAEQRELLDTWYRLDDNAVPSQYALRPRDPDGPYAEYVGWQPIEAALQRAMYAGARAVGLTGDDLLAFFGSATHQEIAEGALRVESPEDRVVCVFRDIDVWPGADGIANFIDADQGPITDLKAQLARLVPETNIVRCTAGWSSDTRRPTRDHLTRLADGVYEALRQQIDREFGTPTERAEPDDWHIQPDAVLDAEGIVHHRVAERHLTHFVGRDDILVTIAQYLTGSTRRMLVVAGEGGVGKSALMAKVTAQARAAHPRAQLVYRFIGATPASSSGTSLLRYLCLELCRRYGGDEAGVAHETNELMQFFRNRLATVSAANPLILVLDGLDQLPDDDPTRTLTWLPFAELPEHVWLIVSSRPGTLNALEPRQHQIVELRGMEPGEGETLLDIWLKDARRTLQPAQRGEVLNRFTESRSSPLYLRLAFEEARRWASSDDPMPLTVGIEGIVRHNFFARLGHGQHHGIALVSGALGYLAASRYGLAEDEILNVLSRDTVVYSAFLRNTFHMPPDVIACAERWLRRTGHDDVSVETATEWLDDLRRDDKRLQEFLAHIMASPDRPRLPVVLWSRLLVDLEPYLTRRALDATPLLDFYHRELRDASSAEFVTAEKERLHVGLARCFRQWGDPTADDSWKGERRALRELPYHLVAAAQCDEVEALFTDIQYLEAKVTAGLIFDLPEDLRIAVATLPSDRPMRSILQLLDEAIRRDIHFIGNHAVDYRQGLFQCLWNTCWWYDSPAADAHYEQLSKVLRPWNKDGGPKLYTLLERWRRQKEEATPSFYWMRSIRPPVTPLDSGLLGVFRLHRDRVTSVAWYPSGRFLVSGSWDQTVRICDVETGVEVACIEGQPAVVSAVAVSPQGELLATGTTSSSGRVGQVPGPDSSAVRIWSARSFHHVAFLRGHRFGVSALAFSPDGAWLASGGDDGALRLWDMRSFEEVACFAEQWEAHQPQVRAVTFSPDSRYLAAAWGTYSIGPTSPLLVFDVRRRSEFYRLEYQASINTIAYSADGQRIVNGDAEGAIRIIDAMTGEQLAGCIGHDSLVDCSVFLPGKGSIFTTGWDGTARIGDGNTLAEITRVRGYEGANACATVSLDGRYIATGGDAIRIWRGATIDTPPLEPCGHKAHLSHEPYDVVFSPDGSRLATSYLDGTIIWDAETGAPIEHLPGPSNDGHIAFAPNSNLLAISSSSNGVTVWNTEAWRQLARLANHVQMAWVRFSPDGRLLASGGGHLAGIEDVAEGTHKEVLIWEVSNLDSCVTLKGHEREVTAIAFSPDGSRAATSSNDGTVRVWNIATGVQTACLRTHIRTNPDLGRSIFITGSDDQPSPLFSHHEASMTAVAFSPDGLLLLTGASDEAVRIWNAETGALIWTWTSHSGCIQSVEWSPDGATATATSETETVVWDAQTKARITRLDGTTDVEAVVALRKNPLVALRRRDETAVYDAASKAYVAFISMPVSIPRPDAATWAGKQNLGPSIATLEGVRPDVNRIATAVRLWQFRRDREGAWHSGLSVRCPWCGDSFPVDNTSVGGIVRCAQSSCGRDIAVDAVVCDQAARQHQLCDFVPPPVVERMRYSIAHPASNADEEAARNIAYQKERARAYQKAKEHWMNLPTWKRWLVGRPKLH